MINAFLFLLGVAGLILLSSESLYLCICSLEGAHIVRNYVISRSLILYLQHHTTLLHTTMFPSLCFRARPTSFPISSMANTRWPSSLKFPRVLPLMAMFDEIYFCGQAGIVFSKRHDGSFSVMRGCESICPQIMGRVQSESRGTRCLTRAMLPSGGEPPGDSFSTGTLSQMELLSTDLNRYSQTFRAGGQRSYAQADGLGEHGTRNAWLSAS